MADFVSKPLAQGQLAITETSVYQVPGSRNSSSQAVINFFSAHNTSATTQTVVLYLKTHGGTSRIIRRATLLQDETVDLISDLGKVRLSRYDDLRAETTTASVVDYAVSGELTR